MKLTSWYSVIATSQMEEMLRRFSISKALSVSHHFENEAFNYYVMKDASGNCTDFIEFKNKKVAEGLFGIRMNTDNFEEMRKILESNGMVLSGEIHENQHNKHAIFVSTRNEPSVILFEHKK